MNDEQTILEIFDQKKDNGECRKRKTISMQRKKKTNEKKKQQQLAIAMFVMPSKTNYLCYSFALHKWKLFNTLKVI